ncbi:MAG TPA: tetratricopeptide repeat protein [Mycobacteriales bacterium]|nr:tetratricopeptide repeat protein [Mycobacteriales bacterium]
MASALLRRTGLAAGTATLGLALVVGAGVLAAPSTPAASTRDTEVTPAGSTDPLDRQVAALQDRLRRLPQDWVGHATLGAAFVELSRRNADPSLYAKAEQALQTSLRLHPADNSAAHSGLATLAAARHDFKLALEHADRSLSVNAFHAATHGVRGDALLELGRYEEAYAAFQRMVDLRPGTASYARASYAWEVRGQLERAIETMEAALEAASAVADTSFAAYHLSLLHLETGDVAAAERVVAGGLRRDPESFNLALASAKVAIAKGDLETAAAGYQKVTVGAPAASTLTEYGDLLAALGRTEEAKAQYQAARDFNALEEKAGVSLDADAVLLDADLGDPAAAMRTAQKLREAQGTSIFTEDAYAWALHANGRHAEAMRHADSALRIGTRSALLRFHRGMIAKSLGDRDKARADLTAALEINPHFSLRLAPIARKALAELG